MAEAAEGDGETSRGRLVTAPMVLVVVAAEPDGVRVASEQDGAAPVGVWQSNVANDANKRRPMTPALYAPLSPSAAIDV